MFSLRARLEKVRELTKSLGLILCGSGTCVQNDNAIHPRLAEKYGRPTDVHYHLRSHCFS